MRAMRPESSLRTMLGPRRLRLRLVDFLVRIWLLKAWPALNLPDAVLRNRLAAARLVLILGMAQLLKVDLYTRLSGSCLLFPSCSGLACLSSRHVSGFQISNPLPNSKALGKSRMRSATAKTARTTNARRFPSLLTLSTANGGESYWWRRSGDCLRFGALAIDSDEALIATFSSEPPSSPSAGLRSAGSFRSPLPRQRPTGCA